MKYINKQKEKSIRQKKLSSMRWAMYLRGGYWYDAEKNYIAKYYGSGNLSYVKQLNNKSKRHQTKQLIKQEEYEQVAQPKNIKYWD